MAKKKSKAKSGKEDDYEYDDTEEGEWVEDEASATTAASMTPPAPTPENVAGTNLERPPDEPVYGTPEETRDLPEPDRSEAPVRPEDEEPPPYGSDISPNQAFNVKAGSMPEDRPDHDKPLAEKGKDPAYGYDVAEDNSPKGKRKEK